MAHSFTDTISSQTIDIDLSKTDTRRDSMATLCTDIFIIVIRMRESEDLGEPAALRKLILHYIKQFDKNCKTMGIHSKMINNAIYALVALLDETVMSVPGECSSYWVTNPLQLELFGDNIAGEEFYRRLERLKIEPKKMRDVIEIYYLCLSIGYEGKYRLGDAEIRDKTIDKIARLLIKTSNRTLSGLSPHGKRVIPQSMQKGSGKVIPFWIVGIAALLILIAWWFGMYYLTNASAIEVLSIIK